MKVIINLPNSATALASMMLSDTLPQEKIDAAVKQCEEQPTELDLGDLLKKSGQDNSDVQAFEMAIAIFAISKAIENQDECKETDHPEANI